MFKILTAIGLLLLLGGLACHFASLSIFNALIPKDAGGQRVAASLSYGPHKRQRLDLYRPDGRGPFPVLFFSYGGSWDSGWRQDYGFVGRAFAAQGYLTAIALGPETIAMAEWLPLVWGLPDQAEPTFKNEKELQRISNLIARFMNEIQITFEVAPQEFEPLFCVMEQDGKELIDGELFDQLHFYPTYPQSVSPLLIVRSIYQSSLLVAFFLSLLLNHVLLYQTTLRLLFF